MTFLHHRKRWPWKFVGIGKGEHRGASSGGGGGFGIVQLLIDSYVKQQNNCWTRVRFFLRVSTTDCKLRLTVAQMENEARDGTAGFSLSFGRSAGAINRRDVSAEILALVSEGFDPTC